MKNLLMAVAVGSLIMAMAYNSRSALAEDTADPAVPVELFACSYKEGMGPDDLDAPTAKWTAWADSNKISEYSAWELTKFYSGPEQNFDVIWLGVASNAAAMGRGDDLYLASGGDVAMGFEKVLNCDAHTRFAAVQFNASPQTDNPSANTVLSFSDCKIAAGKSFRRDVAPGLEAWVKDRTMHGSKAGQWALFPAYGGGGEEFDFKWVSAHANHEALGTDWDRYNSELAEELFDGVLECDSSRVYNATNIRRATE